MMGSMRAFERARALATRKTNGHFVYRCEQCETVVPAGTPRTLVVVETRPRRYPYRPEAHRLRRRPGDGGKGLYKLLDDEGGEGYEIVKEMALCPACAQGRGAPEQKVLRAR